MATLTELIRQEDPKRPYTDEQLAQMLQLRREQVGELRRINGIPNSWMRLRPALVVEMQKLLEQEPGLSDRSLTLRLNAMGYRIAEIPVPMILHTDAVRDSRSPLSTTFSARRLGEGQALACAMKARRARAYIRHEREKFTFYALDWLALALLALVPGFGLGLMMLLECMQLGWLLAQKRPRAFISQKLFFFGLPLGLMTYRERSRAYAAE